MDSLKYQSNYLLVCNDALSLSCCDTTPTGFYWEGVPCDSDLDPERYCIAPASCAFGDRKYINTYTVCQSNLYEICESKRVRIDRGGGLVTGYLNNQFNIQYNPVSAGAGGSVTFGFDTVSFSNVQGSFSVSITGMTLNTLISLINGAGSGWSITQGSLNGLSSASIIAPVTKSFTNNYPSSTNHNFDTVQSSIIIEYGRGGPYATVNWDGNPNIFATGLALALDSLAPISTQTRVVYNPNYDKPSYASGAFEIVFDGTGIINGETACGYAKDNLYIKRNHLIYTDPSYVQITDIQNPIYDGGWFSNTTDEDYLRLGSGVYDGTDGTVGNLCQLESRRLEVGNIDGGPYPYDVHQFQCVPQRGGTIGTRQPIGSLSDGSDGYSWDGTEFDNLENTVVLDDGCYRVSPFFFLYGKEGRFNREPSSTRRSYIPPNCDISSTGSTGCGTGIVPTNCSLDLFLPKFSIYCPWGPFGKYYRGILTKTHPNQNPVVISLRTGKDYRPSGLMKTRGEWTRTDWIDLKFVVRPLVPFYLGSDDTVDDRAFGVVDVGSLSGFDIVSSGNTGCFPVSLTYSTSGKTVGDFVNAINAIRLDESPGAASRPPIFDFCLSHSSVADIPANKIVNVSSELYDLAVQTDSYNPSYGAVNPETDLYTFDDNEGPFGGSDILSPMSYSKMLPKIYHLSTNTTQRVDIYDGITTGRSAKLPPYGRLRTHRLPKETQPDTSQIRQKTGKSRETSLASPWWQAMNGSVQTVINVTPNPSLPSEIDRIEIECVNRKINVYGMLGGSTIGTASLDTKKNYEYKVSSGVFDLNNLTLTVGSTTFNPIVANSGSQPYPVWLDDYTYWSSTGLMPLNSGELTAVPTPINWSYREPLLEASRINLTSRGAFNLKSWIRQRTCYTDVSDSNNFKELNLAPCTPYDPDLRVNDDSIDCSSDMVYLNNYVLSYGCTSSTCKTEWYIKATRCSCDQVFRCEENLPHPLNQEGDSTANEGVKYGSLEYTNYSVGQPTIYICKENIHIDCDIPFLIKVPYQAVSSITGYMANIVNQLGTPRFIPCTSGTIDLYYADGAEFLNESLLFGGGLCPYNHTPPIYQSEDFSTFCNDCGGWCQFIDPANPTLVAKEDIPIQWPPKAYVVERGYPVFCSLNPYKNSIAEVCDDFGAPSYCGWDRIVGVKPYVPPEYLSTDGLPCVNVYPNDYLTALTRPMITNLKRGDLCGDGSETRYDITCGTKCCECDFRCNPSNGYLNYGPYAQPCFRDYNLEWDMTQFGYIYCNTNPYPSVLPCNYSVCIAPINPDAPSARSVIVNGLVQTNTSVVGFYREMTWPACGCIPSRINGTIEVTQTRVPLLDCASQTYSIDPSIPYADPETATPCNSAWAPNNSVYNLSCDPSDIAFMLDGHIYATYADTGVVRGPSCGPGNNHITENYDVYIESVGNNSSTPCFSLNQSWNVTTTRVYNGTSPIDSETLGIIHHSTGPTTTINPTWEEIDTGTYSSTEEFCETCNAQSDGVSYSSVTGWLKYNYFNSADWYKSSNLYGVYSASVDEIDVFPTGNCIGLI